MSTSSYRVRLLKIITFVAGLYFVLDFILPEGVFASAMLSGLQLFGDHPSLHIDPKEFDEHVTDAVILVGSMAVGLGLINLIGLHGSKILFVRRGWINSVALILGLSVMMLASVGDWLTQRSNTSTSAPFFNLALFAERIALDEKSKAQNIPPVAIRISKLHEATQLQFSQLRAQEDLLDKKQASAEDPIESAALQQSSEELNTLISSQTISMDQLGVLAEKLKQVGVAYGNLLRSRSQRAFWHHLYSFLNEGLFVSLGSAMFSLLGVYIAVAAFRAFRVRSFESGLMMLAAIIVMLGQISFGVWLWQALPEIRQWLMEIPNSAAFRAIKFGSAIAGLVLAIRMWLSIESETFSSPGKS